MRPSDRDEFIEFFEASWPATFRRAYALTGDYQSAEDAAQSAYAKAYRMWSKVSKADDRAAYVRRMATNEVLTVWRRFSWRAEKLTDRVDLDDNHPSHEDGVVETDTVWCAVMALPPRQRAIVVLRYYEDLSEREIAATLGIRPGSVKSQASVALASLRKVLRTTDLDLETGLELEGEAR